MATATVVAPMVETLVSLMGTSADTAPAHTYGSRAWPSPILPTCGRAASDSWTGRRDSTMCRRPPEPTVRGQAIGRGVGRECEQHMVERNIFTQMAEPASTSTNGTHDDTIVGNVFTDIGGPGSLSQVCSGRRDHRVPSAPTTRATQNEICHQRHVKTTTSPNVTTEFKAASELPAGTREIHRHLST